MVAGNTTLIARSLPPWEQPAPWYAVLLLVASLMTLLGLQAAQAAQDCAPFVP